MSSSSAIEEATTTTVNTPPYKRVCCDQLFTSYQNFYRHRKRRHGEDISKRKQGQEEKRELIEKQRQETYQRKLQFIVMKLTPSLDLIPGLDAKVTSHPFILFFPPGFIYMILTDKATIGRPGPNLQFFNERG